MAHRIPDRLWWLPPNINELPDRSSMALFTEVFVLYGLSHTPSPDNQPLWSISLLFIGAALLILTLHYVRSASQRRKHFRQRSHALQGHPEAMFLAAIPFNIDAIPQPSELLWKPTHRGRVNWLMQDILALLLDALLIGFGTAVLTYFGILHPPIEVGVILPLSTFVIGMIVAQTLASVVNTLGKLSMHLSKQYGVISNADGIRWYSSGEKKFFLRWEELALFEVEAMNSTKRRYRLYGQTVIAEWSDTPPSKMVSLGDLTSESFWERHQALLNLIVTRTRLLPRTLDKRLAIAEQPADSSRNN